MKRAEKPEQHCRRQEFICKLYGIIKDLDKSLKSECNQGNNQFVREKANPFEQRSPKVDLGKKKAEECYCPPGCCEDSLEFKLSRIPNYPGTQPSEDKTRPQGASPHFHQEGQNSYNTHNHSHFHEEGQHSHTTQNNSYYNPTESTGNAGQGAFSHLHWHKHDHGNGCWPDDGSSGQRGGQAMPQAQSQGGFCFPCTPEEAMAMGCFVAKAA